jgi:myo-inositol-1(or 4)-monophosphatase
MDAFESVARALVANAGERLHAAWGETKVIEHKGVIDIVTETDREIEALVTAELHRAFPDHLVIAEEASVGSEPQRPLDEGYVWYLDPLDGTTNFAHGYPQFAVSLALARGRELLLGIVHDPVRNETFVGRCGGGATLNDRPIRVSTISDLEQALLGTGFPYDRREHVGFYLGFLADLMVRAQGVRRSGSAALDLSYVACGRLDAFWEWKLKPWDTAAGALILKEAGGAISDFRGERFDLHGQQTLASNGRLHPAMIEVLTARLGKPSR